MLVNWLMDDHHLNFIIKIEGKKKTNANKHQLIVQKPKKMNENQVIH
jgi:hypothetical protein